VEESPEEDPDLESGSNYGLEELLFFLIESGLSENAVYGWHEGWPMDRLQRAFIYFKMREIEKQQGFVTAVSIGASSLFSQKAIEQYMNVTNRIISKTPTSDDRVKTEQVKSELGKLTGIFNG